MLISRRKRREEREVNIYLNHKLVEQVKKVKYLGIIIDEKYKFSEHITYAAEKCKKTNLQSSQIGQNILGTRIWSSEDDVQRGDTACTAIGSTDLGRCSEILIQQTEVFRSAKAN
jgi:hypothetical protein